MIRALIDDNAERTTAVILGVDFGRVVCERAAGGNVETRGHRTLRLRVEPAGSQPYAAELVLAPDEPMVPARPGTRVAVLVDPHDRGQLALRSDGCTAIREVPGGAV
jgi:hypothetical protein